MGRLTVISDWLGHHGEPLEPEELQFTTKPAKSCRGCLFDGQRSAVCNRATEAAGRAELANCETDGVIYVAQEVDARQMELK